MKTRTSEGRLIMTQRVRRILMKRLMVGHKNKIVRLPRSNRIMTVQTLVMEVVKQKMNKNVAEYQLYHVEVAIIGRKQTHLNFNLSIRMLGKIDEMLASARNLAVCLSGMLAALHAALPIHHY